MLYNRISPDTDLTNYIECYWTIDNDDPTVSRQKIIPDCYPEIIIHYGDPVSGNIYKAARREFRAIHCIDIKMIDIFINEHNTGVGRS
jgi:hypothetical protein